LARSLECAARWVQPRITSQAQADTEEQRARRQAYSACATALLARQGAVDALLEVFRDDDFDPVTVQIRLQDAEEQRSIVARAVGAVAVEGPDDLAQSALLASRSIELLSERLRDWYVAVVGGRASDELLQSQLQYALRD